MGDTMINGNETFSAPYAGSDALSSIDFSKAQITNTIGTGDFDQASLNSSGHQNVFAHAESYEYGLGKYYEEDPDNWAHWDKYRIRHDIVNAIKQMPTDKAWEYITGLGEEDEDPELDEEYALHQKNKDLDAALKNLIIERDFIQEPQGTGILNELSAKNYYKNAEFIELTDDMVLDICVMAHEDGHGVYEVYPVDLVRQAMQRINENPSLMERFHKKIGPMSMGAEVDTSPDRLPGESKEEMKKRRDTPEYKAARKERQKKKREDVQKTAPYLKVKDYEKHTTGKSYVLDVGLPSKVLLHMEDLENSGMKIDEIDTIQVHSQEGGRFPAIIDSRFKGKAAETFAAASTARPDLPREKRNVLNSVRSNYDPSFSWSSCSWGPYFNRFAAEGSNKFYSVWVWERAPGIYTAMGAYGGLGQNPRLFNVGQTRDLQQAVNMAKKKLQSKQKKGYQTYSAEYMENLSNAIVQFEDGAGFSSASAPPNDIFFSESFGADTTPTFIKWFEESEGPHCWTCGKENLQGQIEGADNICEPCDSKWIYDEGGPEGEGYYLVSTLNEEQRKFFKMDAEEGSTPVQDPMELGEMANWTPMDGSEGLKRKRAESQVFALTYFLQNDVNMEDINDVTEALELYLSLSEDIAEMDASGLQKHPRYEVANRMLSDLSYRLDELQTQLPEIDVDIEMDAEYEAWRSAFTDGAAATQLHKYDRNWMQKVMNPRSRQIKSMWNDAQPSFNEELRSAEFEDRRNQLTPDGERDGFYISNITDEDFPLFTPKESFLQRLTPLSWGLGMVAAFFLGKKL